VLTARTGRHGLNDRLKKLGYELSAEELNKAYQKFLTVADKKQEVFDEDLVAIVHDEIESLPASYELEYLQIYSGTASIPTATVRLRGQEGILEGAAIGDGPVDATCKAICAVTRTAAKVKRYEIRAITGGADAMGEVSVQIEMDGRTITGRAASTDVIEASARAFLNGLNRMAAFKPKAKAEEAV
jgi:2-isopropylmalate synthase